MRRVRQAIGASLRRHPFWGLVGVLLVVNLAGSAYAQGGFRFNDGTFGLKVAVYDVSGTAQGTVWSSMDSTLTSILNAMSPDATHGSAVIGTGPQGILEGASDVSANTAVSDGQAVRSAADLIGRQLTLRGCDRGGRLGGVTTITDGSSTAATGFSAAGAGVYNELHDITIANTSATAVTVDLRDGTAGSVLWTFPVPANTSGVAYSFQVPRTSSANTAFAWDPSAAASSIIISASGCKGK